MFGPLPSRRDFALGLGAALASPAPLRAAPLVTATGATFGTHWRVVGLVDTGMPRLRSELERLFSGIDEEMSPWRNDSAISDFNRSRSGGPASAEMIRVAKMSLNLANKSEGAFDPTVGPLVARWGFGPIDRGAMPDWRKFSVRDNRMVKEDADLTLDFCGLAKGRALDRAIDLAREQGIENLLMDIGGELRAIGRHPDGRDWQVAVEHPMAGSAPAAILHLPAGMAVATSGLGAQSFRLHGRLWGHIIDPAQGQPVDGRLRSVTVLATDAMTADGWATALFAAGDDAGPAIARGNNIAALFLYESGTGLRNVATGGIESVLT